MINDEGLMKDTLARLSNGDISLMQATFDLRFQDAGYTLKALRAAGLTTFQLDDKAVEKQACLGLEPLRDALKTKPSDAAQR